MLFKNNNFLKYAFELLNFKCIDLVGMNVLLVTTDAFAIEKQRIRGIVDNCHALIERSIVLDFFYFLS